MLVAQRQLEDWLREDTLKLAGDDPTGELLRKLARIRYCLGKRVTMSAGPYLVAKFGPEIPCQHGTRWVDECDLCIIGVSAEQVANIETFWQSNTLLAKLGLSVWEGKERWITYKGDTTPNSKLDQIQTAIQRDEEIGGRKKVGAGGVGRVQGDKMIGPDSDDARFEDTAPGTQRDSAPDPDYVGQKPALGKAAGAPIEAHDKPYQEQQDNRDVSSEADVPEVIDPDLTTPSADENE